jgi:hypothetical protein
MRRRQATSDDQRHGDLAVGTDGHFFIYTPSWRLSISSDEPPLPPPGRRRQRVYLGPTAAGQGRRTPRTAAVSCSRSHDAVVVK